MPENPAPAQCFSRFLSETRFCTTLSQNLRKPRLFKVERKPPHSTAKSAKNQFSRFSRLSRFFLLVAASLRQVLRAFRG